MTTESPFSFREGAFFLALGRVSFDALDAKVRKRREVASDTGVPNR